VNTIAESPTFAPFAPTIANMMASTTDILSKMFAFATFQGLGATKQGHNTSGYTTTAGRRADGAKSDPLFPSIQTADRLVGVTSMKDTDMAKLEVDMEDNMVALAAEPISSVTSKAEKGRIPSSVTIATAEIDNATFATSSATCPDVATTSTATQPTHPTPTLQTSSPKTTTSTASARKTAIEIAKVKHIRDLVGRWNYPFEEHKASSENGYIQVVLHRIPNPRYGPTTATVDPSNPSNTHPRPAVLIWHGLGLSSNVWCCSPTLESNLAFVLADAGFDVWMGNSRGNYYTEIPCWDHHHRKEIGPIDELGYYDIPASVDYILEKTGRKSMSYIGYSQGTTAIFAALSVNEELNAKFDSVVCLAPALRPKGGLLVVIDTLSGHAC
jgi:predicted esterase